AGGGQASAARSDDRVRVRAEGVRASDLGPGRPVGSVGEGVPACGCYARRPVRRRSGRARPARSVAAASREPAAATGLSAASALARLRLADVDLPAGDVAAVQTRDGLAGLARRAHLDEAEATRATGIAVRDHGRRLTRPHFGEQSLEVRARGVKGSVPDEYLLAHSLLLPPTG